MAGWAIARQHPKGRDGTVFVTIEDEEGDVQVILWPRVYDRYRREMANDLILIRGVVDRRDGTTNVIVSQVQALEAAMAMPAAHDWH
ncbi:MAG: OB-fold nucleic acid binding domain-containing protein [Anaerolineaceae bacterium]|nr:OB-fold nucleic acid binding domain-containing protein [Anaerolineaceae bacterium]